MICLRGGDQSILEHVFEMARTAEDGLLGTLGLRRADSGIGHVWEMPGLTNGPLSSQRSLFYEELKEKLWGPPRGTPTA